MAGDTHVFLVEDDFYARNWMELLLRRDWRTRVVQQAAGPQDLPAALADLSHQSKRVDLILIDTDTPLDDRWLADTLKRLAEYNATRAQPRRSAKGNNALPAVLFTGVNPNRRTAALTGTPGFAGYILKNEIQYSLAWAVTLAAAGHAVITPGVLHLFDAAELAGVRLAGAGFAAANPLPTGTLILDGRRPLPLAGLSARETEAARLAFLFSMERQELADELMITEDYSFGLVSLLFEKIGLNDVLNGAVPAEQVFGDHPAVRKPVEAAIAALRKGAAAGEGARSRGKKIKNKETLAFHLLTLPQIEKLG